MRPIRLIPKGNARSAMLPWTPALQMPPENSNAAARTKNGLLRVQTREAGSE
jgi:hypothetical protein